MRASIISPWGKDIRGGLRTYTEHLVEGFQELGEPISIDVTRLARFHDITERYVEWLAEKAVRNDPDVVHIQHEGKRYGNHVGALYDVLSGHDVTTVTTVHSAAGLDLNQAQTITDNSDGVIVHNGDELGAFQQLEDPYLETTVIIPHGCVIRDPPSKPRACAELDFDPIPETVVGTYGFLGPWKQVQKVTNAVHKIAGVNHSHFGEWHTKRAHGGYAQKVRNQALTHLTNRHQWPGYVEDEDLKYVFGATDMAVYTNEWASESGSMAEMMGAGVPVIANDIKPYNDGRPVILVDSQKELERAIRRLRDDDEEREKWGQRAKNWAMGRTWEHVGWQHFRFYDWLLNTQDPHDYIEGEKLRWNARHHREAEGDPGWYDSILDRPQLERMLARYVRDRVRAPVLEIGIRSGELGEYVSGELDGIEWHGIDAHPGHVEAVRDVITYESVNINSAENLSIFPENRFGSVVVNMIEHSPAHDVIFEEVARVLEPGGRMIVDSPLPSTDPTKPFAIDTTMMKQLASNAELETVECQLIKGSDGTANLVNHYLGLFEKPGENDQ